MICFHIHLTLPNHSILGGSLPPHGHRLVTIVGSRRCSEYGKLVIKEICASLKGQDVSLVSGLAYGADSFVHEQALANGIHTIAVVGSGLEDKVLYPKSNLILAHRILDSGGALISEQKPAAPSRIWMFPARNRIMVGMSSLVIIIEAREKSGTLITARLATDYNRDLIVVPNSIHSPYSKGSNDLIRQGAYIYTKPADLFELLKLDMPEQETLSLYSPTPQEDVILRSIADGHTIAEKIISACLSKLSISEVLQGLLNLEIQGVIKKVGGQYILTK